MVTGKDAPMLDLASPAVAERVDGAEPELSVVVASVNGWEVLEPTLRALDAQPERDRMEVIVVEARRRRGPRERLREWRPAVVLIESERQSIPRLRYRGVARTRGKVVAILEDHGEVAPDWAATVLEAHRGPWGAVGGAVENGKDGAGQLGRLLLRIYALHEPGCRGRNPRPAGEQHCLQATPPAPARRRLEQGRWESWINDRLRRWRSAGVDACDGRPPHQAVPARLFPGSAVPLRPVVRRHEAGRPVAGEAAHLRLWLARSAGPVDGPRGPDRRLQAAAAGAGSFWLRPGGAVPDGRGVGRDDRLPVRGGPSLEKVE